MSKNTMVELVTELEELSDTLLRDRLVKEALEGAFHDYRSKSACGKMYFIRCADWFYKNIGKVNKVAHDDITKMRIMEHDIKNGDYDETYTEADSKIVLAEAKADPNMDPKDKEFFLKAMAWKGDKNKTPYGKNFF